MAKVTLPLGSELARGHVGSSIIFQGTIAKAYRKPRTPNTIAQVARKNLFRDCTRTLKSFGAWARGALRSQLGINWWAAVLPIVSSRWATSGAEFESFSLTDRAVWLAYAPYGATSADAGLTFYAVTKSLYDYFLSMQLFLFSMPSPAAGNGAVVRAWIDQNLSAAFMPGSYDDDHTNFLYSGPGHWDFHIPQEVEAQIFFGMSYAWSVTADLASVEFYFLGNQVHVYYWRQFNLGTMQIEIDNFAAVSVSQSLLPYGTLYVWQSEQMVDGLHFIRISQAGITHPIYFDGVIVQGAGNG
jgi:hypothetical protein